MTVEVFQHRDGSAHVAGKSVLIDTFLQSESGICVPVRRQGFWNRWLDDLAERLAHLFVDLKRLDCGIANAVV